MIDIENYSRPRSFRKQDLSPCICLLYEKSLPKTHSRRISDNFPPVLPVNSEQGSLGLPGCELPQRICHPEAGRLLPAEASMQPLAQCTSRSAQKIPGLRSPLHHPALHHKIHLLHQRHIAQRIPRHRHNVSQLPRLDRPERVLRPHQLRSQ